VCLVVPAGAAIAAAVLDHLAHTSRCCGLFATHYHQLAAEHAADPAVAIMHMACAVAEQPAAAAEAEQQQGRGPSDEDDDVAEVTFLYKLTAGEYKLLLCAQVCHCPFSACLHAHFASIPQVLHERSQGEGHPVHGLDCGCQIKQLARKTGKGI
jgi:hypothetical protein